MSKYDSQGSDVLDEATESLRHAPVPTGPPPQVTASTIEALQTTTPSPQTIRRQHRRQLMFRIARYGGLSAAAVVLIAVTISLLLTGTATPIAFAEVIENVEKAKSVTLISRQKIGDQPEFKFKWYLRGDKIRMEMADALIIISDLKRKKCLQINVANKVVYQFDLEAGVVGAFANPVDQIRQAKSKDAKQIGKEKLNGRQSVVYQFEQIDFLGAKGKGKMKVWVDPKTKLPVKIRLAVNSRRGAKPDDRPFDTVMVLEDFEWNKKLDPKLFEFKVPKGFEVKHGRPGLNSP